MEAIGNKSLEDIYREYMDDIYRYLHRLTRNKSMAEDLMQETFFRAYQYLEWYEGEKVRPWLFKVAYHTFIDWQRKNKRLVAANDSLFGRMADETARQPEKELMEKEGLHALQTMLELLPDKQRQVVMLRFIHQFSYEEIVQVLEIPMSDVKSSLFRARQKMRKLWKEQRK